MDSQLRHSVNTFFPSNSSKNFNKCQVNLPCITDNKKIYIHKPSDFFKHKYTYLGKFSNNNEILSPDNIKKYQSPKFCMEDIKEQAYKEKRIITSILKDEVKSLPSLLKNCIPEINKNKKNNVGFGDNYINFQLYEKENPIGMHSYVLRKYKSKGQTMRHSNNKELKDNNTSEDQTPNKNSRLVNLNFLITSPKKRYESLNDGNNRMSYYQFYTTNNSKSNNFLIKTNSKKYSQNGDYISIVGNANEMPKFNCINKTTSFKNYLNSKAAANGDNKKR